MSTGIRAYVDKVVGSTKDILVMLNDNNGIANVAKFFQYTEIRRSVSLECIPIDGSSRI